MIIRHAEHSDFLWLQEHDRHISKETLETKIESNEIYIATENNETLGWLRYNLFWDHIPFMNLIYFLKEHRGKGFGKMLVNHWEKEMKEKGYTNVLTSTLSTEETQHFYRKLGYTEIGGFKLSEEPFEIMFNKNI